MLIDTHAHLQFHSFRDDRKEVIKRTLNEGISFIMPGTQIDTSRDAVKLAEKLNDVRVWAAVGLHPIHVEPRALLGSSPASAGKSAGSSWDEWELAKPGSGEVFNRAEYEKLIKSDKVVAVGEIGLDYWRKPKTTARKQEFIKRQKETFIAQLNLALEYKKPLILHCRVAHDDMIEVLEGHPIVKENAPPGVVHSFTGNLEQLNKFLELGFYVGVNGLVYKLDFVAEAVREAPLDRILLETDAPYLLPPQITETKRNEPIYIKHIAQKIAEIKNISFEEVAKQTTENAQKLFKVDFK